MLGKRIIFSQATVWSWWNCYTDPHHPTSALALKIFCWRVTGGRVHMPDLWCSSGQHVDWENMYFCHLWRKKNTNRRQRKFFWQYLHSMAKVPCLTFQLRCWGGSMRLFKGRLYRQPVFAAPDWVVAHLSHCKEGGGRDVGVRAWVKCLNGRWNPFYFY